MQGCKVILTWEAIYDIVDIENYIETEFGIERANKFQIDIQRQMEKLEISGNAFGKTDILYRQYCIQKKTFSPSIIFFIVKQAEREIHILRVLREERDWKSELAKQQEYTYL